MDDYMTTSVRTRHTNASAAIQSDICVLGAGISGISAALEAARLGRRVVLVDGAPALGGQAIGSIIGTIIGLYSHGPNPYQLTHGIADEIIAELGQIGALHQRRSSRGTITFQYDVMQFGRWMERRVEEAGIEVLLGALLSQVAFANRRVKRLQLATRFGPVTVEADGYVDASGDASLCWQAGLAVRKPDRPVYGSLNFLLEGYDEEKIATLDHQELYDRLAQQGKKYGLVRQDGFLFSFPGKGFALANITHIKTPLDPLQAANTVFAGRRQADNVVQYADNIIAAGRCIDADPYALSSVRVMGPCIGMGAAAAHCLDLAGASPVHQIDIAELQNRLYDNLERTD